MIRSRYWKITRDEASNFTYNHDKLINWEIKCVREPESDAMFIGVFLYRHGTPYNYDVINGIAYFHNNIPKEEVPSITKFLQDRYGGSQMEKDGRVFLKDSKQIYSAKELAELAAALEEEFKTKAVISLEFEDISHDELKEAGLPEAKLLPIPGK